MQAARWLCGAVPQDLLATERQNVLHSPPAEQPAHWLQPTSASAHHIHAAHCSLVCLQVQKLLGKGSYGIVYRVKRKSDGVVYALKEADVRKMSPVERMDAVNEIRLLASVKHQNVVRYHEAFLDGESARLACWQCCSAGGA